jgi:hypothetical protein
VPLLRQTERLVLHVVIESCGIRSGRLDCWRLEESRERSDACVAVLHSAKVFDKRRGRHREVGRQQD